MYSFDSFFCCCCCCGGDGCVVLLLSNNSVRTDQYIQKGYFHMLAILIQPDKLSNMFTLSSINYCFPSYYRAIIVKYGWMNSILNRQFSSVWGSIFPFTVNLWALGQKCLYTRADRSHWSDKWRFWGYRQIKLEDDDGDDDETYWKTLSID